MPFATEIAGWNVTVLPSMSNVPSGDSPVVVRIKTLPFVIELACSVWLKVKRSRWFSAIRVTRQPDDEQPRSHDSKQNASEELGQRTAGLMPAEPVEDEPPEQPARNNADNPLRTTIDRENRLMERSIG